MRLKYLPILCLGGCIAYTYDYGAAAPYRRAYSRMESPLTREEVPPAPNAYAGARIYGLLPPAPQEPTVPRVAPPPSPAPAEPASGRSAAEGLRLVTPPQPGRAPGGEGLSDPALRELLVLGAERSPAMSFALSLGVGFGCGHYYVEDASTARAILGGEIVGLGMFVLGHLQKENEGQIGDDGMMELGAIIFAGFRAYEILTVTSAANRYNQQLRARFGVGVVPTRGGAMVGAGWRY